MELTYIGHSCFKLKGKKSVLVTDPYQPKAVGFSLPPLSAEVVTVSHDHEDHNAVSRVTGTARRDKPYVISAPGEYEILGIGVFGWGSHHDDEAGKERGKNTMYTIHIDGVSVGHLGDLGHTLTQEQVEHLGLIDILLVPVGGVYTLDPVQAATVVAAIQPSYIVPMHYKTAKHNQTFAKLEEVTAFVQEMGGQAQTMESLTVTAGTSLEEAEIIILQAKG
ncbi:hypothetical protein A2W24_04500 [Microgenomates group bacterium RBG_16_45_19]|nr:MAG: hypothetical protein A2W24_04500 [Microgenomates group bacterium RBG_16_45_19]